jgi:hypothetical protein
VAGDPYKVFREGEQYRREAINTIWPELYEALAQLDMPKPAWGCALMGHGEGEDRQYVPVVGRIQLNGTPACAVHLQVSDRPGGYPLEMVPDTRKWKKDHGMR